MNKTITNTEITVVIVIYKESFQLISKTLSKLMSFKVIIIDNDNNKKLKNKIVNNFHIHEYILNKKNIGFSAGYNQGIRLSDTAFTLVLGPDCIILERDILILKKKIFSYSDCFIVSPLSYDEKGNLTYSGGPLPEKAEKDIILSISGDTCVDSTLGACMFFKTQDIIENELLLDENFFIYFSDDDLCRRIKNLNKTVIQVYEAKSIHQHGSIKVKNKYLKKFIREFNFSKDRYYYYYKTNNHQILLDEFKKKIPNLFLKLLIKTFFLRFLDSIEIFSRLYAYYKFKNKFKL
jgi:N-acetylglucosaminyl-diphospho-decaprenol L-rhamnosyltransferase